MDCPVDIELVHEQVALFVLEDCSKCIETKDKLKQSNVNYIEFDLSQCSFVLANGQLNNVSVAPTIIIKKDGKYLFLI